jgi:hypothetical protein
MNGIGENAIGKKNHKKRIKQKRKNNDIQRGRNELNGMIRQKRDA